MSRSLHYLPLACIAAACLVAAGRHPGVGAQDPADGGRRTWLADCAVCHGADATGTRRGPDITRSGTASVDFMVRTGRMPLADPDDPLERRPVTYSEDQIEALVSYTGSLVSGPVAGAPDLAGAELGRGQSAYTESCAACHQAVGAGGALAYGDLAPPLGRATSREVAEAVRTGPGNMPRFGRSALSDDELRDVAAYVAHLQDGSIDRGGWSLGHLGPVPEGLVAWVLGLGAMLLAVRWLGSVRSDDVDPSSTPAPGADRGGGPVR